MTGFGKGVAVSKHRRFTVEIRSVNSKQLDLNLKVPGLYRAAEIELRSIVNRALRRGKVDLFLTVERTDEGTSVRIDEAVFAAYADQLRRAAARSGLDASGPGWDGAVLQGILRMPDVVSSQEQSVDDEELAAIYRAAELAAEQLNAFREQEGATLIRDLLHRVDLIEQYKNEVEPYEKARTETIRTRLRDNLAKLAVDVDPNRLEQEMIYYLEKLDITEEKVRLKNHCDYFRQVAAEEEDPGRKLGFIAQEMGREINTLGSKSNEANMQILVVRMKDELEKIKEQVLNLL